MKQKYYPELKMKVFDEHHSRTLQQALFKLGYRWIHPANKLKHTQSPYLFTDRLGLISHNYSDIVFEASLKVEVYIDNLYSGKVQNQKDINGVPLLLGGRQYKLVES